MITEIGQHRVKCGNIMDGIDDLMQGQMADLVYSDPPWGGGNLKYWETMRLKQTGATERRDTDLISFMNQFFKVCRDYASNVLVLQYGIQWREMILGMAKEHGFGWVATADIFYKSGSKWLPLDQHLLAINPHTIGHLAADWKASLDGKRGREITDPAAAPFLKPGGIILDPCCGLGHTAALAKRHGMLFRGNELNSKRLETTMEVLRGK